MASLTGGETLGIHPRDPATLPPMGDDLIAKRLQDFGFTESASKAELDRFCEAMIATRAEISEVGAVKLDRADNPLKHARHTAREVMADVWAHDYSRAQAAFPLPWVAAGRKYWPPVKRVDNVYGDRNLACTCAPLEAYAEAAD